MFSPIYQNRHKVLLVSHRTLDLGPQIAMSPLSVDASFPVGDEIIFDCYIENAVEYRWYKTGPGPRENFVRSGNQLVFDTELDSREQGTYVCEGIPGSPYQHDPDSRVRTEPATFTHAGKKEHRVVLHPLLLFFFAPHLERCLKRSKQSSQNQISGLVLVQFETKHRWKATFAQPQNQI